MEKDYPGEAWSPINFNFDFVNKSTIEVSNFGRVRTFNKISNGNIIKGSMINGYKIIRLKFFKARETETELKLAEMQDEIIKLSKDIAAIKKTSKTVILKDNPELHEKEQQLTLKKKKLSKKFQEDVKSRTIHYHALIHRLVAEYFMQQPSPLHTVVAHIDFNKLDNRKSNLKWMTPEENYLHQRNSPHVIASKNGEDGRRKEDSKATKLSVTKVMLLKKLLNQGKPIRSLVKQFKVTETQILRIKRGENWAEVQAAT